MYRLSLFASARSTNDSVRSPTASLFLFFLEVDAFLVNALLKIMQNGPMPIHMASKCFERTFKLPFRAFRQPSFVEFLSQHPQVLVVRSGLTLTLFPHSLKCLHNVQDANNLTLFFSPAL